MVGIAPREEAGGGVCGGSAVAGRGAFRLKTQCISKPSAYASATDG